MARAYERESEVRLLCRRGWPATRGRKHCGQVNLGRRQPADFRAGAGAGAFVSRGVPEGLVDEHVRGGRPVGKHLRAAGRSGKATRRATWYKTHRRTARQHSGGREEDDRLEVRVKGGMRAICILESYMM